MGARDAAVRGLAAGLAGTVAMTASQRAEMRVTGREPSDLPAQVAEGLLGISPRGRTRSAVGFGAHWINNSASGLGRAAVGGAGLRGLPAIGATFVFYMTAGALLFARLGLAPPLWRRGVRQLAIETVHAGVWATVTSVTYELLEPGEPPL
jgi:hypothetical protein